MSYTLKELEKETCSSFGGSNCVLHDCMFNCQLAEAIQRVAIAEGKSPDSIKTPKKN